MSAHLEVVERDISAGAAGQASSIGATWDAAEMANRPAGKLPLGMRTVADPDAASYEVEQRP